MSLFSFIEPEFAGLAKKHKIEVPNPKKRKFAGKYFQYSRSFATITDLKRHTKKLDKNDSIHYRTTKGKSKVDGRTIYRLWIKPTGK